MIAGAAHKSTSFGFYDNQSLTSKEYSRINWDELQYSLPKNEASWRIIKWFYHVVRLKQDAGYFLSYLYF